MKTVKLSILALLIPVLISCGFKQNIPEGSAGTYVSGGDMTVLYKDGTYEVNQRGRVIKGEYSVDGDKLTLKWGSGYAYGRFEQGKIIDNEGRVWVKQ